MRVCFISEAKSIHTQRWVRGIAETGHEVHLISSSACNISAIKLHERPLYHANPLKALQNIYAAKKIIKELRPDIVHLFGLYSLNSIFLLPAVYGIKNLVVSPWGTDVVYDGRKESYKSRFIKRLFLGKAKAITSVSRFMTREIRKYLKKNKEIEYIPFGVDIELFHPRYLTNNGSQFTIGITKSLTEKYGHRYLLEAIPAVMAQCPQISLRVIIIGRGTLESRLKDLVKVLKIEKYVSFVKHIHDQQQLREYLKTFDVYVMPSVFRSETLGVAAIEASAMGIPVIASHIGGIPEVVEDKVTGLLVQPRNTDQIATALIHMIRNDKVRRNMGKAARQKAETFFSFEESLNKMDRLYTRTVHENAAG